MIYLIITLFLAALSSSLQADAPTSFDDLDLSIEITNTQEEDAMIVLGNTARCNADQIAPSLIIAILTSANPPGDLPPVQLQNILLGDLYNKTYAVPNRTLHLLPTLTAPIGVSCGWALQAQPFINITKKMAFTPSSSKILSYINLIPSDDFLNTIDNEDFPAVDIPDVLSLFGNITLEERRIGAMLTASKEYKSWFFSAALPVYYLERNFFLKEKYKKQLEDQPLFSGSGTLLPGLDVDTFLHRHLVSDKGGNGDLRLETLYNFFGDQEERSLYVGGQITLPTAHAFKTGIIGGTYCPLKKLPAIDFQTMFNYYGGTKDGAKSCKLALTELVVDYGIEALDRLTAVLADAPLGQEHVLIGPMLYTKHQVWGRNSIEFFGECEWGAPDSELRFFKVQKNPADFVRNYADASPDAVNSNLQFLQQQATNTLYPTAVKIRVHPGFITHFNAALLTDWNDYFSTMIGYDFWNQADEKLGDILCRYTPGGPLDFASGRKPGARESKIFGGINTTFCETNYTIRCNLTGDITVHHHGIGPSATAALGILFDF